MAYAGLVDIQKHIATADLIDLTDDAGTGSVDETVVLEAIATADELIDGYLRGRYAVPLATVPGLIRTLSVDLAVYVLYDRKKFLEIPEQLKETRKNAVELLGRIAKGEVVLGITVPSAEAPSGDVLTNKTAADRVFTADLLGIML